jgi:hypothetical protein
MIILLGRLSNILLLGSTIKTVRGFLIFYAFHQEIDYRKNITD